MVDGGGRIERRQVTRRTSLCSIYQFHFSFSLNHHSDEKNE